MTSLALVALLAVSVAAAILALHELRGRYGSALLYTFIGMNQCLQVFVGRRLTLRLPGDLDVAPASAVLFAGTLFAVLLVYLTADVPETRRLIYGVVAAAFVSSALLQGLHELVVLGWARTTPRLPVELLEVNLRGFVASTSTLVLDALLVIVVYEVLARWGLPLVLRFTGTLIVVLALDSALYVGGRFLGDPEFTRTLAGHLVGKSLSALVYGLALWGYVTWHRKPAEAASLDEPRDVFSIVTYRERYEGMRRELEAAERGAKAALAASEERFRRLFETATDGVLLVDGETGRVVDANPALAALLGVPLAAIAGRSAHDLLGEHGCTSGCAEILGLSEGAPLTRSEVSLVSGDGRALWVDLHCQAYVANGRRILHCNLRDVSDRRRAEEALRRSNEELERRVEERTARLADQVIERERAEERYRRLVESSPDAIVVYGEGLVRYANAAAARLLGLSTPAELVGEPILRFVHPLDRARAAGFDAAPAPAVRQARLLRADGAAVDAEAHATRLVYEGRPAVQMVIRDVTQRRRVERMQTEFVATVSHELLTPLTSIRGSLALLHGGVPGSSQAAGELLEIALRNSERLLDLINDLLDMSKIEEGLMAFDVKAVPLEPLLQHVIDANRPYADLLGRAVVLGDRLPSARVSADPERLEQVLGNLVSNAIKFSDPGRPVTIGARRGDGGRLRVSVHNQGEEIPRAFRQRIFQKFQQADSSDTRGRDGTGLGLTISKALVEGMGGTIGFTSDAESGTTFFLDLPEALESVAAPAHPADLRPPAPASASLAEAS